MKSDLSLDGHNGPIETRRLHAGERDHGGQSVDEEYDNAWVGGTGRREEVGGEKWQTGSSWTPESRAAQEMQAAPASREGRKERRREEEEGR